jgi:hypothetical protein
MENFVPFGFKMALLFLQKTCDKISDGKLCSFWIQDSLAAKDI